MSVWRNAGTSWYRRAYEGVYDNVHTYAWTRKGAEKKVMREYDKLVTKRVGK